MFVTSYFEINWLTLNIQVLHRFSSYAVGASLDIHDYKRQTCSNLKSIGLRFVIDLFIDVLKNETIACNNIFEGKFMKSNNSRNYPTKKAVDTTKEVNVTTDSFVYRQLFIGYVFVYFIYVILLLQRQTCLEISN